MPQLHEHLEEIKINNCLWDSTPLELFIRPTSFHNADCFLVGAVDATVRNMNLFLQGSNQQKTSILGYISHNIQTPLNKIKHYLDSLQGGRRLNEQVEENSSSRKNKTGITN